MFGTHIKKEGAKNYIEALQKGINEMNNFGLPMKSAQIFISGPQNVNYNFTEEEAKEFGKFAKEKDIKVIVHNSYVASLWTETHSRRPFFRMQIMKQLELCDLMNAAGFVIHLPNDTVENILTEIRNIHPEKFKTIVYLETKSTKPHKLSYEKIDRLNELFLAIKDDRELNGRVGYCIDTAHLWSSGVSLTTKQEATQYLHELSLIADGYLFAKDTLCFHLNDAQNPKGSGLDVHEALRLGRIWDNDDSGLKVVIHFIKQKNLIAILERNKKGGLDDDCKLIKDY